MNSTKEKAILIDQIYFELTQTYLFLSFPTAPHMMNFMSGHLNNTRPKSDESPKKSKGNQLFFMSFLSNGLLLILSCATTVRNFTTGQA